MTLAIGMAAVVGLSLALVFAVLSAAEVAVTLLPAGRIHRLEEAGRRGAVQLSELDEQLVRLRGVTALFGGLAQAIIALDVALIAAALAPEAYDGVAVTVAVVCGALLVYTFAQALPRTVAIANVERVGLGLAPVALLTTRIFAPFARALEVVWAWAIELVGGERISSPWAVEESEVGTPDTEDAEREEAEEALLEAVSDFAEKVTREVMVPRPDVASLPETATFADAINVVERRGFSRLPVYRETVDDVRGVLYAKDVLIALGKGTGGPTDRVSTLMREPMFVPETKPVEELLVEMRDKSTHIAVVTDEYGGTAGIVTMEDLLEEIFGEIADEYDREVPLVVDLGDGRFRVDARLPVDDLNEEFGTAVEPDFDSVGGLVLELAGHIPVVGESVEVDGVLLTVARVEGTRIRQLVVEPVPAEIGDS